MSTVADFPAPKRSICLAVSRCIEKKLKHKGKVVCRDISYHPQYKRLLSRRSPVKLLREHTLSLHHAVFSQLHSCPLSGYASKVFRLYGTCLRRRSIERPRQRGPGQYRSRCQFSRCP